jgi:hypothetical protein
MTESSSYTETKSTSKSKLYYDRQSVRHGIRHPHGTRDRFFFPPFSLWLFLWQFRFCWCGTPSLTRSRVCTFQFLPGIASQNFSDLSHTGLMSIVYCLCFWDSPNQEGQVRNRCCKCALRCLWGRIIAKQWRRWLRHQCKFMRFYSESAMRPRIVIPAVWLDI